MAGGQVESGSAFRGPCYRLVKGSKGRLTAEFPEVLASVDVFVVLMSAGRAGSAGASFEDADAVAGDADEPVNADTPPAAPPAVVDAPALSQGLGGLALLVVAICLLLVLTDLLCLFGVCQRQLAVNA